MKSQEWKILPRDSGRSPALGESAVKESAKEEGPTEVLGRNRGDIAGLYIHKGGQGGKF